MSGFPYPNVFTEQGTMYQSIVNLISVLDEKGRKQLEKEARAAYVKANTSDDAETREIHRLALDVVIAATHQTASETRIPTAA